MGNKLVILWESSTWEERFAFMLDLDRKFRGRGNRGDGILNFHLALMKKLEDIEKEKNNDGMSDIQCKYP